MKKKKTRQTIKRKRRRSSWIQSLLLMNKAEKEMNMERGECVLYRKEDDER